MASLRSAARASPLLARFLNFFGKVVVYEGILRIVDNSGPARAAEALAPNAKKDCPKPLAHLAEGTDASASVSVNAYLFPNSRLLKSSFTNIDTSTLRRTVM